MVGDRYGALTLAAATLHGLTGLRVHQDGLSGERALAANAERANLSETFTSMPLDAELFTGAEVVLWQLPRRLEEIAEVAELISAHAGPNVQVFAGGRVKHMALAMNNVLAEHFASVVPGRAWRKSRPLTATGAAEGSSDVELSRKRNTTPNWTCGCAPTGPRLAAPKLMSGTRFLLEFLPEMRPGAATAIDLGCGNGTIAVSPRQGPARACASRPPTNPPPPWPQLAPRRRPTALASASRRCAMMPWPALHPNRPD